MLGIAAVLFFSAPGSLASEDALQESEAKCALIFNFAKFTTWPKRAFPTPQSPLIIGVIGTDPFGKVLDKFAGKTVKGRPVAVRYFATPEDFDTAHILFCNAGSSRSIAELSKRLALEQNHVLTVGDRRHFARHGGIIGIRYQNNRLTLEINTQTAKRSGIHLSGNLVRLAKTVY